MGRTLLHIAIREVVGELPRLELRSERKSFGWELRLAWCAFLLSCFRGWWNDDRRENKDRMKKLDYLFTELPSHT